MCTQCRQACGIANGHGVAAAYLVMTMQDQREGEEVVGVGLPDSKGR